MSRGEKRRRRYVWPLRGLSSLARGAVRSTIAATLWAGGCPGATTASGRPADRDAPRTARRVVAPAAGTVSVATPSGPVTALAPPAVTVTPAAGPGVEVPGTPVVLNWVTATANGVPAVADAGAFVMTRGKTVGLKFASEVSTSMSSSPPGPRRSLHSPLPNRSSTHSAHESRAVNVWLSPRIVETNGERSQLPPVPASSAAAALFDGQVVPSARVTGVSPSVTVVGGNSVALWPSTRTVTVGPASAGAADTSSAST